MSQRIENSYWAVRKMNIEGLIPISPNICPDRVREVCKKDRSIAIAHGLEDTCEVEAPALKKKGSLSHRKKDAAR